MKNITKNLSSIVLSIMMLCCFAKAEETSNYLEKTFEQFIKEDTITIKDEQANDTLQLRPNLKHTVIYVYTTWCPACQKQTPILKAFSKKNPDKIRVIAIDATEDSQAMSVFGFDAFPGIAFAVKTHTSFAYAESGLLSAYQLDIALIALDKFYVEGSTN